MTSASHAWLADRRSEPALVWMIAASTLLHFLALGGIYFMPKGVFSPAPPAVVAYTVKIVDPSALGGRLPRGPLQVEKPPSGTPVSVPEEQKTEKQEKEVEKPPKPEVKEEKTVTLPEKKPEPKPAEKETKVAEKEKKATEKAKPEKKPTKEEVAKLERDRQIQEAIRRMGEKGKGKEAAGLGGTEPGKGAALGTGGEGGGGGILMGLDFIIYKNQVEGIIKKNWTWVGANPDLMVRVGFRIEENGEIQDPQVVQPSSDAGYDESVMRAIRASSPLPPPPEKYRDVFGHYLIDFVSGELAAKGG